jgi:hypothetical protein
MKAAINSDEPEESLLTAKDAWQDYQSLKIALAEEGTSPTAQRARRYQVLRDARAKYE